MTITRAKKTSAKVSSKERPGITAEQFIEGVDRGSAAPLPELTIDAAIVGREGRALSVVKSYLPWAAGAGMLPLPGVDVAAIIGVQLRMLAGLASMYEVPFREQAARSVVAALMATIVQNTLTGGVGSAIKFVPGVGALLGMAVLPFVAAAGTYAVGKVFITHFEAGGTFLDFDPQKVRTHYRAEFEKSRAAITGRTGA